MCVHFFQSNMQQRLSFGYGCNDPAFESIIQLLGFYGLPTSKRHLVADFSTAKGKQP